MLRYSALIYKDVLVIFYNSITHAYIHTYIPTGEIVVASASCVMRHTRHDRKGSSGSIFITNYRMLFIPATIPEPVWTEHPEDELTRAQDDAHDPTETSIPLAMIKQLDASESTHVAGFLAITSTPRRQGPTTHSTHSSRSRTGPCYCHPCTDQGQEIAQYAGNKY